MKYLLLIITLCLFATNSLYATAADVVNVTISVNNVRNEKGEMLLIVFAGSEGFPGEPEKAFMTESLQAATGKVTFDIELPPGSYAFSILHDENSNEKMDTTWYGKPKEGFGVSNNPVTRRRPPGYEEAEVKVSKENNNFAIAIIYF